MKTTVINIKQAPKGWSSNPQYVYIGRPSIFGNPFVIGKKCSLCDQIHRTGGSTLDCFKDYFWARLTSDPAFYDKVIALKGKTLVCFCKPRPCHGDEIVRFVEAKF